MISDGNTFPLLFAWAANPPTQLTSHFDVFWVRSRFNDAGRVLFPAPAPPPIRWCRRSRCRAGNYTLVVASPDQSAAGKFLKLWAGGDGLTALSVSTSGSLISPQAMVPGTLTIGAVNGSDGIGDLIRVLLEQRATDCRIPGARTAAGARAGRTGRHRGRCLGHLLRRGPFS